MAQIVLDAEAFKALSSDTRLQILKALDARPLTVSELGRFLNLNKATVFEHLKQLTAADLVKKTDDEGRKWVYYKLTWKGKNVVHPENVQFMLLLGTAVLSVGGVVGQLLQIFARFGREPGSKDAAGIVPSPSPTLSAEMAADAAPASGPSSSAPASSTSAPGGARAPENAAAPPDTGPAAPADDGGSGRFIDDPNVWLLVLLGVLLLITTVLAWQYLAEQRRERAEIRRRLQEAPLQPEDQAT